MQNFADVMYRAEKEDKLDVLYTMAAFKLTVIKLYTHFYVGK